MSIFGNAETWGIQKEISNVKAAVSYKKWHGPKVSIFYLFSLVGIVLMYIPKVFFSGLKYLDRSKI